MTGRTIPSAVGALLFAALTTSAWGQASTAVQTVDTMNMLWGKHPGMRANHAKGVVVEGSFTATKAAAGLSKAEIFAGKPVPVTVRFSDSTGLPTLPDGSPGANPHGMSIKFRPAGGELDVVTNSLGFFPVATGEDFLALLQALAASGPDAAKPTKAEQFFASHPSAPKAFGTVATPPSFAKETYNGVDAFVFVDVAGKKQPFRFKIVPVSGTVHLPPAKAAAMAPDFLVDELPKRLAQGKVTFHIMAQLAAAGDSTSDATKPWPEDRTLVDLGTLTIDHTVPDSLEAQKKLLFLPGQLTDGIEVSDDPLIDVRDGAYVISFGRRAQ